MLRRWARETRYDVILASASSLVPYFRLPELAAVPAVVDFVDVDSQKWLDYATASRGPRAWLYRTEGERLRRLEQDAASWARAVLLVSEAETNLFRHACDAPNVTPSRMGSTSSTSGPTGRRRNRSGPACSSGPWTTGRTSMASAGSAARSGPRSIGGVPGAVAPGRSTAGRGGPPAREHPRRRGGRAGPRRAALRGECRRGRGAATAGPGRPEQGPGGPGDEQGDRGVAASRSPGSRPDGAAPGLDGIDCRGMGRVGDPADGRSGPEAPTRRGRPPLRRGVAPLGSVPGAPGIDPGTRERAGPAVADAAAPGLGR